MVSVSKYEVMFAEMRTNMKSRCRFVNTTFKSEIRPKIIENKVGSFGKYMTWAS